MASSSSSITFSNFLASLLPGVSPPQPQSSPSLVSFPRNAIPSAPATISTSRESPARGDFGSPSLMWFKSSYNVQVLTEANEPEEKLLMRFRREVFKAGVLNECRRRRYFENPRDKKKRKVKELARLNRKRPIGSSKEAQAKMKESLAENKDNEEDDNWDGFNVDLPYLK